MDENLYTNLLKVNTEFFAQETCHAIESMTAVPYAINSGSFERKFVSHVKGMLVSIHFSGRIQGDFFLSMDETVTASLFGIDLSGMSKEEVGKTRESYSLHIMELLNASTGKTIFELNNYFSPIEILLPNAMVGETFLPEVDAGSMTINGICGEIKCVLSINRATLGIGKKIKRKEVEELTRVYIHEFNSRQKKISAYAHRAGMADVATEILHNIGNILNNVITSSYLISERLENSKIDMFQNANDLLRKNIDDIENFITNDPKSKKLFDYYLNLGTLLQEEREFLYEHSKRIRDRTENIKNVVAAQQKYSSEATLNETLPLHLVVENALSIQQMALDHLNIGTTLKIEDEPKALVQEVKLVQVLIHLFKNAADAMKEESSHNRKLTITVCSQDSFAFIKITDTGKGIANKNMNKIFTHGFTTQKAANGFGLHSCANFMTEMKGRIRAESEGEGKGATFVLEFACMK